MRKVVKKFLGGVGLVTVLLLAACGQVPTGKDGLEPQLLGGSPASIGWYPWTTQIWHSTSSGMYLECAGVLLSESWVVTAASCVPDSPTVYRVVVGDAQPAIHLTTGQDIEVWDIFRHPDYDAASGENNLALIELATPVSFPSGTSPSVAVAEIADVPAIGRLLQVAGWGAEGWNTHLGVFGVTDTLTSFWVERVAGGCGPLSGPEFCARADPSRRLTFSDLGDPIMNTANQVVGIATKLNTASLRHYSQYTSLSFYRDWIDSYIRPRIIIDFFIDPCLYRPGLCALVEIPILPDDCWVCNFDLDIIREANHIRFWIPELGVSPKEFSNAFALSVVTPEGKLIAQAQGNSKEAALELSANLPKGSYKLQVSILDQTLAKTIHANPQKYEFKFSFSPEK